MLLVMREKAMRYIIFLSLSNMQTTLIELGLFAEFSRYSLLQRRLQVIGLNFLILLRQCDSRTYIGLLSANDYDLILICLPSSSQCFAFSLWFRHQINKQCCIRLYTQSWPITNFKKLFINFDCVTAIRLDGCNVAAYTYWSLLDSLEWSAGYTLKFGLYRVNFTDPGRERTAKDSATYYADLIKDNGWKCPARNAYLARASRCPTGVERTPSNVSQSHGHGCVDRHSRIPRRVCEVAGLQLHCFRSHRRRCWFK